jgi:pilus assembly protein Flp/PilA
MGKKFTAFFKDETGATAIEYGLIATGIAVAIITVTKGLGSKLNTTFTSVSSAPAVGSDETVNPSNDSHSIDTIQLPELQRVQAPGDVLRTG